MDSLPKCFPWLCTGYQTEPAKNRPESVSGNAPSSKVLGRVSNGRMLTIVLGSANIQVLGSVLVAYGLATWWLGGSGLLLAGIGASIWLVSTIFNTCKTVEGVIAANEASQRSGRPKVFSVSKSGFKAVAISIGWATPAGWVINVTCNLYILAECLAKCASAQYGRQCKLAAREPDTLIESYLNDANRTS